MNQHSKTVNADDNNPLRTLKNLWPYMWPKDRPELQRRVMWAILALLAAKVFSSLVPFAYKAIIDSLETITDGQALVALSVSLPIIWAVAYGVGMIISIGFEQLRDSLFASVGQHAVRRLAYETFIHLHNLSLRYHLQRRTGGLSRVIERGTKGIETIVRFTMLNTGPAVVEFVIIGVVFGVMFGFWFLVVTVGTIWLYIYFTVRASNWRIGIRRTMNKSDTDAHSKAIDSLLNFETVKYFSNEHMETERFDKSMAVYEKAATRMWTSLGFLNFGQTLIFWIGMIIIGVMTVNGVLAGDLTLGDFVLINAFMMQIYRPLNFIGFVYREIRQGLTDIEEMFVLLDQDPEIKDIPDARPLKVSGGALKFDNVSFYYDDRPILKNVSFEIGAGQTVAVVGPSGAGKSTLSRLIYRFYEVIDGKIEIDGQNVREVTQLSLRRHIGMVPQDTVLFNDTIDYNIRYGRPDASHEEMRAAAEQAQIGAFIKTLPQNYETEVGERGLKLSGGEKQRVAIARTLLKQPPILILDEATSALDTHTEREIQSALDEVAKDRTTLVIAHRLSTVVNADQIIVLKEGEIAERGRHEDLLAAGGLYAQMWNRQREVDEAEQHLRRVHEADDQGFIKKARQPVQ